MRIEFAFDFSCPFAYLGSTQIEAVARRAGAELVWKPMLLGGVFKAVDTPQKMFASMSPPKARHNGLDMFRWAALWGVPLSMPREHPMRTVRALRALLSLPEAAWPDVVHALYRAYWVGNAPFSEPATVEAALVAAGIAEPLRQRALAANDDPAIKAELRTRTDAEIARGVFGAPTSFVMDPASPGTSHMFWGQDRLQMVEDAARGWNPLGGRPPARSEEAAATQRVAPSGKTLEFWHDFSSPFSYLASTQIEAIAARTGATLQWRPMLLGAVFKHLGGPDVPMLEFSGAKRGYYAKDIQHSAAHRGVPFRFASRFPIRSVTALRLALAAGERIGELSGVIYRAAWVDDQDIADEAVLTRLLSNAGFNASELLARTREPELKQQLFANTSEAIERGVFGAPTCIVGDELFWGHDRLDLVERELRVQQVP